MSKSFVLWVLEPGQGLPHSYQYHLNRNELNKNVLSLFVSVGSHCFDFLGKEPIWEIQVKTRKCFEMENSFGFELAKTETRTCYLHTCQKPAFPLFGIPCLFIA